MIPCHFTTKPFSTFNDYIKNQEGKGINYLYIIIPLTENIYKVYEVFWEYSVQLSSANIGLLIFSFFRNV